MISLMVTSMEVLDFLVVEVMASGGAPCILINVVPFWMNLICGILWVNLIDVIGFWVNLIDVVAFK
jgi:hypothetical protein